jgi:hypothetical protein
MNDIVREQVIAGGLRTDPKGHRVLYSSPGVSASGRDAAMVQVANQHFKHVRISVAQPWGKRAKLAPGGVEAVTRRENPGPIVFESVSKGEGD